MKNVLSAKIVEQIHQATLQACDIQPFVSSLDSATLTGLMEYGALQVSGVSLPELPAAIMETSLAAELSKTNFMLGSRQKKDRGHANRRVTAQEFEFLSLSVAEDSSREIDQFLVRLRLSAKGAGFKDGKDIAIAAAIAEMLDNAIQHSASEMDVLVGYQIKASAICCCICDLGVGILASLRSNPKYSYLTLHKEAIRKSLETGVSRLPNGGTGFNTLFTSLTNLTGILRFRSGEGCISMDGTSFDATKGVDAAVIYRPGFQVSICCQSSNNPTQTMLL